MKSYQCLHNHMIIQDFVTRIAHVQGLGTARELFKRKLDKLGCCAVSCARFACGFVLNCRCPTLSLRKAKDNVNFLEHAACSTGMDHGAFCSMFGHLAVNLQKLSKVGTFECLEASFAKKRRISKYIVTTC